MQNDHINQPNHPDQSGRGSKFHIMSKKEKEIKQLQDDYKFWYHAYHGKYPSESLLNHIEFIRPNLRWLKDQF